MYGLRQVVCVCSVCNYLVGFVTYAGQGNMGIILDNFQIHQAVLQFSNLI